MQIKLQTRKTAELGAELGPSQGRRSQGRRSCGRMGTWSQKAENTDLVQTLDLERNLETKFEGIELGGV